jgi:hypothetical protein
VDCHNRPTHIYAQAPEFAVDRLFATARLDPELPFLRREAVALLKTKMEDRGAVESTLEKKLAAFYGAKYPEVAKKKAKAIPKAARELAEVWRLNNYPRLKITWGTYPSHLGHRQTTEGCFRCHDDEHKTQSGRAIRQDCDLCHDVLADEEEKPDVPKDVLDLGHL